jgi:SAM-dependent methyltransferase
MLSGDYGQFAHEGWERAAGRYEDFWMGLTTLFIAPLLKVVGAAPGVRILDVACGPGCVSEAAARLGAIMVGVDFSRRMVALARRRNPGLEFLEDDAQQLPFDPGSFDAVVMNFGVMHVPDPEAAFSEARRVLRPGGRFGFTCWGRPEENPGVRLMGEAVEAHADMSIDLPEGPPRFQFSDAVECRRALQAAGFVPSSLRFETVGAHWRVPTPSFLFEAERDAGVRTAAVLARQSPARLAAIQAAVGRAVQKYAVAGGFAIPMTAHVVAAGSPA